MNLPEDIENIKNICQKFDNKIYLCGSGADYFLLNQYPNNVTLKDLDFITEQRDLNWEVRKDKEKKGTWTNIINDYLDKKTFGVDNKVFYEIFLVEKINEEDLIFNNVLNLYIESVFHRKKVLNAILLACGNFDYPWLLKKKADLENKLNLYSKI